MNWYDSTIKMKASTNLKGSTEFRDLVTNFEGLKLQAYLDSVGVWTIGYGHTLGVKKGDVITKERAEQLLMKDVERFEMYVNRYIEVPLAQYQFDALLSFTFNLGQGTLKTSTLRDILNNHEDYEGVPDQIRRFHYAGGKDCHIRANDCYGIVTRREAEAVMFAGGNWRQVTNRGH